MLEKWKTAASTPASPAPLAAGEEGAEEEEASLLLLLLLPLPL
jgi:hypothetical protein